MTTDFFYILFNYSIYARKSVFGHYLGATRTSGKMTVLLDDYIEHLNKAHTNKSHVMQFGHSGGITPSR